MRHRWLLAIVVLAAIVTTVVLVQAPKTRAPGVELAPVSGSLDPCPASGAAAAAAVTGLPDLSFPCAAGGTPVDLGAAPGRPMVLNIWGTWCIPCRTELPLFEQLYRDQPGVTVLGLAVRDSLDSVRAYTNDEGLTFPSALDDSGQFLVAQGLNDVPITYFIAADGTVAFRNIGPVPSYDALTQLVAEHLGVTG